MKSTLKNIVAVIAIVSVVGLFASCEKDEGKLPNIAFKTAAGYTAVDITIAAGDSVKIGIDAAKTEDKDVLKTFNVSVSYDGAADSTIFNKQLTSAEEDNYSYEDFFVTRNQTGTEKYTFTVVNRDGLTNHVSLTVTTN